MIPSMLLHPSDETLSRVADQSDTERMRTRAGRHAARCARCGALVAEYVALGEAARRIEPTAPPPSLAERIGHIPPTSGVASGAPDSVSVPRARGRRRGRTIGLAAAAAVVIGIALAWPALRQRELAAADANALTITPRYPRAGTTAQVRFVPPAGMPATDTLWLEGELRVAGPGGTWDDDALVGMALVRDGSAYVARLPIPPGTLTGRLEVVDTRWPPMQQRPIGSTILLAAGPAGSAPSLDALEASAFAPAFGTSRATLAAEFARWAPNHPLRWVLEPGRSNGGAFDWLGYFTSKERR
ncbi:MAG TPA: hypothetical protein VHM30_19495, partial [Gemmatimonadaceae bacterium]|nr:hypothetical protein [Gemmatimonadaceae bacterium]